MYSINSFGFPNQHYYNFSNPNCENNVLSDVCSSKDINNSLEDVISVSRKINNYETILPIKVLSLNFYNIFSNSLNSKTYSNYDNLDKNDTKIIKNNDNLDLYLLNLQSNKNIDNVANDFSEQKLYDNLKDNNLFTNIYNINRNDELFNTYNICHNCSIFINHQNSNCNKFIILLKKKRGKQSVNLNDILHDRNADDNIQRKIQVHFISFLINISNDALTTELRKDNHYKFIKINYKIKQNISEKSFNVFKSSSIRKILELDISPKYKKYNNNINKEILKIIDNKLKSNWLISFFNMKYLKLFEYYYNMEKNKNSLKFGEKEIQCSKHTKPFYDLLEKYKRDKDKILDIVERVYFSNINANILEHKKPYLFLKR